MNIDAIKNGVMIDHIKAGNGMKLYELLGLAELDATVALIKNATSKKMGKKDIIKVDAKVDINLDIIGYTDPGATVKVIENGELKEKYKVEMPKLLTNVIKCKNPRCITQTEQEINHIFKLCDEENKVYRCIYCETKAK